MPVGIEDAAALLHRHLEGPVAAQAWVQHVEHDPEIMRWYVRFGCDGRDAATVYFDLRQRSLYYELYFMPHPPLDDDDPLRAELLRWFMRRNRSLYTAHFAVGDDGDYYLIGRTPIERLDETELDHILGAIYEATETWFQSAVRMAFRR